MSRNYSGFADLCMMTSGGQPWALDMRQRNGNPALLAYLVDATCSLLIEGQAISDGFQRTPQGLSIIQGQQSSVAMAPPSMVLMALRFIKGRMIEDGVWRPGIQQRVFDSCPELANASAGEIIVPGSAGLWVNSLIKGEWLPALDRVKGASIEVDYAPSR